MKHAWNHVCMVTLGAGLLWGGGAFAKSQDQQDREVAHDSCLASCKRDLDSCTKGCKKHAGAGADLCIKSCKDLHKECEDSCKSPGGKK